MLLLPLLLPLLLLVVVLLMLMSLLLGRRSRFLGTMGEIDFPPSLKDRLSAEASLADLVSWFNAVQDVIILQWKSADESIV